MSTKMLCLHGFGQSSTVFNKRLASFRSKIKNKYEFIIPQAPFRLPQLNKENLTEEPAYAWYYYSKETPDKVIWSDMFDKIPDIDSLYGLQDSIDLINKTLSDNPDIEYILGFSQGAALLSLLCLLGIIKSDKKLIFVSGFYPLKYDTCKTFTHKSMHIIGEADEVIPPKASVDLSKFFTDPVFVYHKGEHIIPRIKITI